MVLATGVFLKALHQRANFYAACVYLSQSSANLMVSIPRHGLWWEPCTLPALVSRAQLTDHSRRLLDSHEPLSSHHRFPPLLDAATSIWPLTPHRDRTIV